MRDERDDFIHRMPLARIYSGKSILTPAKIGMCPWCGESLHPGRKCHNDDALRRADRRAESG